MNPTGAIVLTVFAAIWCAAALVAMTGGVDALTFAPALLSIVIIVAAVRIARTAPRGSAETGKRVGRAVGIATAVQFVAISIAANVLVTTKREDLILPVTAAIVGLHFIPIAIATGRPRFLYILTALMLGLAAGSLLLPPTAVRTMAVGFGAAALLWGASVLALARLWREANVATAAG